TNMTSEQTFSVTDLTISNKRNRLDDESARAILSKKLTLKENLQYG
ncbi:1368_t:CDS:1, partial [Cetraspora pellucida]